MYTKETYINTKESYINKTSNFVTHPLTAALSVYWFD